MSYFLLVNTSSNSGKSRKVIEDNLDLIKHYLPDSEIRFMDKGESVEGILSSISDRFDVVVACGGDGTISSVATSLRDKDVCLGVLPLGTGNDFSKSLGLGKSLDANLKVLKRREVKSVDLIQVNETYFINTLGLGFDGETNFIASKLPGWLSGFRYVLAGLKVLGSAKKFRATIDQKQSSVSLNIDSKMIVIANGKWEGGKYLISPDSKIDDGLLELIYTKDVSTLRLVIEFLKLSFGIPISPVLFETITGEEFSIRTLEPVYIHKDGEVLKKNDHFDLKLFPNQIKVIA